MLDRCQALGMAGRLVVSHAFCLGALDARRLDGLLTRLAALDVALLTTRRRRGRCRPCGPAARRA